MRIATALARSLVLLAALGAANGVATAQTDAPPVPAADRTMHQIERHLADIATTLRELRTEQRVMREIRRLELAERRLQPLRDELRQAKGDARSRTDELNQIEPIVDELREHLRRAVAQGADPETAPGRADVDHYEVQLEVARTALENAENRAIEVEGELEHGRRVTDRLEATLNDLLKALDE